MSKVKDIIKELWLCGYFSQDRSFDDIRKEIKRKFDIRFPDSTLANTLRETEFLIRIWKNGQYVYTQKSSPQIDLEYTEVIYSKGQAYDFYIDIKTIIQKAQKEVMIVDSYADEDLFDVYVEKLPNDVSIKILTSPNVSNTFKIIAKRFSVQNQGRFEARESPDCHDRAIFVDSNA